MSLKKPNNTDDEYPNHSLRLARYRGAAEAIASFVGHQTSSRQSRKLSLLDAGVGRGRILRYLEALGISSGVQFVGVDKNPRRLDSTYDPHRWNLVRNDIEVGLPFETASFDIVLCEQVLEHLSDPAAAIAEIARVARPGALVVLGVPSFPWGIAHIREYVVPRIDVMLGYSRSHLQVFSLAKFVDLVTANAELRVEAVRGFRFISGGPLRPLEYSYQWYSANRWLGSRFPALATEIQVIAYRRGDTVTEAVKPAYRKSA